MIDSKTGRTQRQMNWISKTLLTSLILTQIWLVQSQRQYLLRIETSTGGSCGSPANVGVYFINVYIYYSRRFNNDRVISLSIVTVNKQCSNCAARCAAEPLICSAASLSFLKQKAHQWRADGAKE